MKIAKLLTWMGMGCILVTMGTGCATHIAPHTVHVTMDANMADAAGMLPSVEVHLLAVNAYESYDTERIPYQEYWKPNRVRRRSEDMHMMHFGGQHAETLELKRNHPIWKLWDAQRAVDLYAFADIPEATHSGDWRVIVPLKLSRWWFPRKREVILRLERSGVFDRSPERYRREIYRPAYR